jgi:catechol 2,3-dioxygenase-like lactoylglutathione lyase family enzyme
MRLDHIAYRVKDKTKTVDFFIKAFGYHIQTEFEINFEDGTSAQCIALEPPEKQVDGLPWTCDILPEETPNVTAYHLAPEIFVSDGDPNSIVGQWVAKRDGIGGIHHLAYQVESVQVQMDFWKEKGYAEFTTQSPLTCPGLTQVFTKPSELTGVIYEFIERGIHGFCQDNVKQLMESTREMEIRSDMVN